jgi:hypothetical protein
MKRSNNILLAILTFIIMSACSKSKETTPLLPGSKDSTAIFLKTGDWKLTVFTITPALNGITDGLYMQPDCLRDNLWQYAGNNVFYINEGDTKCNEADPQIQQGTWNYDEASKVLTFSTATIDFLIKVTSSSATSISGYRDDVVIDGSTYLYNGTLSKQ